jgi:hypothetical protein
MNALERWYFDVPGGMYREFAGIITHFQPKDLALYRELLPQQLEMPELPVVTVFFADYQRVVRPPLNHYHYQEWSATLKGVWCGEAAWYMLAISVTRRIANAAGRYLGFPKYISEITLTKQGDSWIGTAADKGAIDVSLEFSPGLTRPLEAWERELVENEALFKGDALVLVPPGRGPRAQRIHLQHVVTPQWTAVPGMARLKVNPEQNWKGLVPDAGEFAGSYNTFRGGMNLTVLDKR